MFLNVSFVSSDKEGQSEKYKTVEIKLDEVKKEWIYE